MATKKYLYKSLHNAELALLVGIATIGDMGTAEEANNALAELWERYHAEEADIVSQALQEAGSLNGAARLLRVPVSSLQRVLKRHPELDQQRKRAA